MRGLIDYWLQNADKGAVKNKIGGRKVYIWGAYFNGQAVLKWLEDMGISAAGFIDGHREGEVYAGKRIFRPQEALEEKGCYVIIAVVGIRAEITDYLNRYHLKKDVDYLYVSEEIPEVSLCAVKNVYRDFNGNEIRYEGNGVLKCNVCFRGYHNKLTVGAGFEENSEFKITVENGGTVVIGSYFRTEGRVGIEAEAGGSVLIGNNCFFMHDSRLRTKEGGSIAIGNYVTAGERFFGVCSKKSPIIIGNDCMFSHDVSVLATSGHSVFDLDKKENVSDRKEKYVHIGDHVWLGKNVTVLYNSCIEKGCIVGTGSVVKGNFEANSVIAGNIAKVVNNNCTWDRRQGIEFGEI